MQITFKEQENNRPVAEELDEEGAVAWIDEDKNNQEYLSVKIPGDDDEDVKYVNLYPVDGDGNNPYSQD